MLVGITEKLLHAYKAKCLLLIKIFHFTMNKTADIANRNIQFWAVPWNIVTGIHGEKAITEAEQTNGRGRDKHICIETKPSKIEAYLLTKILLDEPQWLLLVPSAWSSPFGVE